MRRNRGEKPQGRTRILLTRPGVSARWHYRPKEPRTGVLRSRRCRPKCPTRLPTGWHRRFLPFFGRSYSGCSRLSANERRRPEAGSRGFASCSRGLVFPDGDIAGPNSNTAFDPSLKYSRVIVVMFWQPPSYFLPWSPSSFVVDDVPYSCSEQYMMAEKTRLFQDEQWSSSCCRLVQEHANASVEACATLTPVFGAGRSKTPCYLVPMPISCRIQPKQKNLLSSDNKLLAASSPLDPVWSLGLRVDDHKANSLCQWRGKISSVRLFLPFAKLFATVRLGRRTRPPLVGSDLQCDCQNQEISSAPRPGR